MGLMGFRFLHKFVVGGNARRGEFIQNAEIAEDVLLNIHLPFPPNVPTDWNAHLGLTEPKFERKQNWMAVPEMYLYSNRVLTHVNWAGLMSWRHGTVIY